MKKIIIGILLTTATLFTLEAQAQQKLKLGYINSAELLSMMPEVKTADAKLQEYQKQLEEQNKAMMEEYRVKIEDYQSKEALMADAVKEVKLKEIQDLEQRIQTFQQSANQKLAQKKETEYNPILEKAEKAIKEVADENGYTYIFDTSMGVLLHFPDSDNVMELVKKKLELTAEE